MAAGFRGDPRFPFQQADDGDNQDTGLRHSGQVTCSKYAHSKVARGENCHSVGLGYRHLLRIDSDHLEDDKLVPGFVLVATFLAILVTLSVITWKWFGGKEQ